MVVPNLVFDLLLYGALSLGLIIDLMVPSLHGAATLILVSAATYLAAEDASIALGRRGLWTQESLATALSLSVTAFIYFWWRNDSDLMAVVLHIGMMMASLMVLIALVAAFSATVEGKAPLAFVGLFVTAAGALLFGIVAGALVLFLTSAAVALPIKFAVLVAGAILWKVREAVKPPKHIEQPRTAAAKPAATAPASVSVFSSDPAAPPPVPHHGTRRILVPQRGSLLDRFSPVLLLCIVALLVLGNSAGVLNR